MFRVQRDESGVSLILALGFLLATAIIVVVVASSSSNDLLNSTNLKSQRSLEYAADGAATLAVQSVRYAGNTYSGPAASCLPSNVPPIDGVAMSVFCSAQSFDPISSVTRVINFYACTTAVAPCSSSNAVLLAQVTFDDYSVSNAYNCTPGGAISTCGSAMTINSWVQQSASH